MANVHGLFSNRGKKDDDNDDDDDDANNRYVGGIGARGGGRYVRFMLTAHIFVTHAIALLSTFLFSHLHCISNCTWQWFSSRSESQ